MARWKLIASVTVLLGVALAATPARADDTEQVVIVVEETMPLAAFLESASAAMPHPLVWDPRSRAVQGKEVAGNLTFSGTREEVYAAVRGLLTFYEMVIVPVGDGANRRLLVLDARATAAIIKLKPVPVELTDANLADYEGQDGLFITTSISVENLDDLRDARNALNRIVTGQNIGNVTEVPSARAFIVTDFAPNVVAIYRLIQWMDRTAEGNAGSSVEPVFRAIPLEHANASEVLRVLAPLFDANAMAASPAGRNPQMPVPVPVAPLRMGADLRQNHILLTGSRRDVERVAAAIAGMDAPVSSPVASVQVVRLQHVDARVMSGTLTDLIRGGAVAWSGASGQLPVVQAHSETHSILIQAEEAVGVVLRRLVHELDQPEEAPPAPPAEPVIARGGRVSPSPRERIDGVRTSLRWDDVTLAEAASHLRQMTGMAVALLADPPEDLRYHLQVEDVSLATLLDLLTAPHELEWLVNEDGITIRRKLPAGD